MIQLNYCKHLPVLKLDTLRKLSLTAGTFFLFIYIFFLLNHHQCAASTWLMRRQPYCARMPTTQQLTGEEETDASE